MVQTISANAPQTYDFSKFTIYVGIVVVLALAFDFINGFHDTANSIATSVSTRVLRPRTAIIMATVLNFIGAMVWEGVAKTIFKGLVVSSYTPAQYVIIAALLGAIIWNLITWYYGIPSSSSHALIGGLVGACIADVSALSSVKWSGVLEKVVIPLLTSPVVGFIIAYLVMTLLYESLRKLSQYAVNRWFSKLQMVSAGLMAFSHGSNDAQKSMGIITLALFSAGVITGVDKAHIGIPIFVKIACALFMALGTSVGGWKIIKTMGTNMIKLQPIGGFAAETSAAIVIQAATAIGAPVSTTHIISSSIMGVGAARRFSAVRWTVARKIIWAWVLTIPASAIMAALITKAIQAFS